VAGSCFLVLAFAGTFPLRGLVCVFTVYSRTGITFSFHSVGATAAASPFAHI
jgi:hypothetical protein